MTPYCVIKAQWFNKEHGSHCKAAKWNIDFPRVELNNSMVMEANIKVITWPDVYFVCMYV